MNPASVSYQLSGTNAIKRCAFVSVRETISFTFGAVICAATAWRIFINLSLANKAIWTQEKV
jgi:hypothetical protein